MRSCLLDLFPILSISLLVLSICSCLVVLSLVLSNYLLELSLAISSCLLVLPLVLSSCLLALSQISDGWLQKFLQLFWELRCLVVHGINNLVTTARDRFMVTTNLVIMPGILTHDSFFWYLESKPKYLNQLGLQQETNNSCLQTNIISLTPDIPLITLLHCRVGRLWNCKLTCTSAHPSYFPE